MELLPIGSVILLKDGDKRLMIYGIKQFNEEKNQSYDYVGCLYPEGNISPKYNYVFNHDDIKKIYFVGFVDNEFELFRKNLKEDEKQPVNDASITKE
ncbi:DUF4176 domain-containing protein [Clostridium sp.]|uniref:DUF4176 domain-containing protein n=1 Tax=Clostridium sp. TaxID=1506 RepID=UPI0026091108|nr:DUF4176 domain-containing protein [uncultured Clostridium sp.]